MLKLIGYWKENGSRYRWPNPQDLIDPAWEARDRSAIIEYLRSGVRIHEYLGFSHCRFPGCVDPEEMGNAELTDGEWFWPEGLAHYVDQHSVRLPEEFVASLRSRGFLVPENLRPDEVGNEPLSHDFWNSWSKSVRRSRLKALLRVFQ